MSAEAIELLRHNYWSESVTILHACKALIDSLPKQEKRDAWMALGVGYIATWNSDLAREAFRNTLPHCAGSELFTGIVNGAVQTATQGKEVGSLPIPTATPAEPHHGRIVPLEAKVLQEVFFRVIHGRPCASPSSSPSQQAAQDHKTLLKTVTEEVSKEIETARTYAEMSPESFSPKK